MLYTDPWSELLREAPDADVVFVVHNDFDHYDNEGIETDERRVELM